MPRFSFVVLSTCLIVQASLFYGFSRGEKVPSYVPFAGFPAEIGGWRMVRQGVIQQDVRDILRADDYITREYQTPSQETASLFVAYFNSQRAGQTPHSPKNCLTGSGWVWTVADTIPVTIPGRAPIIVNRYLVSKGDSRSLVLFWYQSRDRVVASEYRAAALTAWDAVRYNRTDTALVRVVVPVANRGDAAATKTGVE